MLFLNQITNQIMKKTTSRRLFLQRSAIATTGIALLSTGIARAFDSESPYDGNNPFLEDETDLVLNETGTHISYMHWIANQQLRDKLFPTSEKILNTSILTFQHN